MNDANSSMTRRLLDRVFPRMPDFYGLINEQCDAAVESMEVFASYIETSDKKLARRVRALEHVADDLKHRNMHILNSAFSTPMDREDLYDAMAGIDHIINFAKTTVFELRVFEIEPDKTMQKLANELKTGVVALRDGFALLDKNPVEAQPYARQARKCERKMKKIYRWGLVDLLNKDEFRKTYRGKPSSPEDMAMDFQIYVMK